MKQVEQYKQAVRNGHHPYIIVNYSNPSTTINRIKHLLVVKPTVEQ